MVHFKLIGFIEKFGDADTLLNDLTDFESFMDE